MSRIAISAGHGLHIRGAEGPEPWGLDEYDENVRVMNKVAEHLRAIAGVDVETYTDTVSNDQQENLSRLVAWHNDIAFKGVGGDDRLDVSIHFNASEPTTTTPRGTEVWYFSQQALAAEIASEIALASGLKDRGAKYSSQLYFLNNTSSPAVLLEIAFCDSRPDCDLYRENFEAICSAIAAIAGDKEPGDRPEMNGFVARGPCSWFGGPDDDGVSPSEGLAFIYTLEDAPHLFLNAQPEGTTGLARRLDPRVFYCACRWPYESIPKSMLRQQQLKALVRANNKEFVAYPADWGPNEATGRIADLSPALADALELETDDDVEIIYPAPLGDA